MNLKCPHNKKIEAQSSFGVICYYHADDGESCSLMNEFNVPFDSLLAMIGSSVSDYNDPRYVASFRNSRWMRISFYLQMSKEKDLENLAAMHLVIDKMFGFSKIGSMSKSQHEIIAELDEYLGRRFFINLSHVTNDSSLLIHGKNHNPKFRILSLRRINTDVNFGDIKCEFERSQLRKEMASRNAM